MHELPWITNFGVTRDAICQYFSQVTQKSLFMVKNVSFYFVRAILCPEHTIPLKTTIDCWFRLVVTKDGLFWFSTVTSPQLVCHIMRKLGTGIVTSYSSIVLAHANWSKSNLHKWITTININFSPPGIHGLVCKNIASLCALKWTGPCNQQL